MITFKRLPHKGQSLVIFAVALAGLLALLALVIDGGLIYSHRRTAQTAADAAALAGARELCAGHGTTAAFTRASEYVSRNNVGNADINVDGTAETVEVTTTITFNTFFAHLIGHNNITVEAEAASGCSYASWAEGVLPVAWSCRWPVNGDIEVLPCREDAITEDEARWRIDNPLPAGEVYPELYIIMDSLDLEDDNLCQEDGGLIECDIDGDGDPDRLAGGDRSWLNLDGEEANANELGEWIENGFPGRIELHDWIGGSTGVATDVFRSAEEREGDIMVVPVYQAFCPSRPDTTPECAQFYHPDLDNVIVAAGTSTTYVHVDGFAGFLISCVSTGPGDDDCPGRTGFQTVNRGIINNGTLNSIKTIEGYFIRDFVPGVGGSGGPNSGALVLLLTQ